jgi:hypothetical protein
MTWTQPKTWTSEPLTSADLNIHLRDNLEALKDPPSSLYVGNQGTDWTTTSLTFVNVDAVNLSLSITTNGGDVMVHFEGVITNSGGGVALDFSVDGVRYVGDDGICRNVSSASEAVSFTRLVTGLSAASHTFNLMFKALGAGTATIYAGAGTANFDVHPQFWVREVS